MKRTGAINEPRTMSTTDSQTTQKKSWHGKPGRSGPPGNKNALKHGLHSFRAMLNGDGLDQRTSLYRALMEKEQEFIRALGGDPSPQERVIITDTIKFMLYASSIDHYLLGLKSIVRKGRVHAALTERTRIGAHIRENLRTLGLERRIKNPTLGDMRTALMARQKEQKGPF
jgi:hypothetical protein